MTTLDASRDYWTDSTSRLAKSSAQLGINHSIVSAEQRVRANHHHARNQYLSFLLMNLLIWPVVVFIGFQILQSHSPSVSKVLLETSGTRSMNADALIATVASQERPVFWLNRLSGDTYTENSATPGVDVISYLPAKAKPQTQRQLDLVIKTYRDSNVYDMQLRPLNVTADTTVENVGGATVTYNPASPDHSVITFKSRPQVIAMTYSGFQSVSTLVMDAQNLEPIK